MARLKIIILDRDDRRTNFVLWADVPAARQRFYADAAKVSAWKDALAADNTALQTGAVAEMAGHIVMEPGDTLAESRAKLVSSWTAFQNRITASNPWDRYGTVWDGAWTTGGVA